MSSRVTFFTTKVERRGIAKFFKTWRQSFFTHEKAFKEIIKPITSQDDIPDDVIKFAFLSKFYGMNDWEVFQRTPSDITDYLIHLVSLSYKNEEPVNATEIGIIGVVSKFFKK